MAKLTFRQQAWNDLARDVVERWARPAAEKIAAACNEESANAEHPVRTTDEEKRGYRAGTEGPSKTLKKGVWRATVITATNAAMADNARHNRLVNHCHPGAVE